MPAINPSQLRIQVAEVSQHFFQPEDYVPALHELFNSYANRVHRPGQTGAPPSQMNSYHIPAPVLRSLEREIKDQLRQHPDAGLKLVDKLWEAEWLETRLLAIRCAADLPADHRNDVLERITAWLQTCTEDRLLKALLGRGLSTVRQHDQEAFFSFVDDLPPEEGRRGKLILYAIQPLVEEEEFENLPAVFRQIKPLLKQEPQQHLSDLIQVLQSLARHSEPETLFFLQHQIPTIPQPKRERLIRGVLEAFNPEAQEKLKQNIREK